MELCVEGKSSTPEEGIDVAIVVIVPLRGAPGRLVLAGVPWATSRFPSILAGYNMESLSELDYLVLYSKLSSCPWAHTSGQAGSTDRSAGRLVGRACLSGTAETLVGGDPWVPMSHTEQGGVRHTPTRRHEGMRHNHSGRWGTWSPKDLSGLIRHNIKHLKDKVKINCIAHVQDIEQVVCMPSLQLQASQPCSLVF
jgi:hypothetical protein